MKFLSLPGFLLVTSYLLFALSTTVHSLAIPEEISDLSFEKRQDDNDDSPSPLCPKAGNDADESLSVVPGTKCTQYYSCGENNVAVISTCPEHRQFSEVLQECIPGLVKICLE